LINLEERFGAPALEAYGLTEAAHQVASNPLPPRPRKPGTVGLGTGVEVAIIDQTGRHLPPNHPGEVVVRGPDVMRGYRNDPEATAAAFIDGWLRTEGSGFLDDDGYLALTGRIKELINRCGEKIAPSEIDDVLLEHPAVAEAAAFGVRDAKYGEEVWAAVVLKGDSDAERLQAFCRTRLADFKVPKVIRIVSAIPKNETGKIERRVLSIIRGANVAFGSMEANVTDNDTTPGHVGGLSGPREIASDVKAQGFDMVLRASNQSTAMGTDKMLESNRLIGEAGLVYAGSGRNLQEARSPAYHMTPKGRVGMIGMYA